MDFEGLNPIQYQLPYINNMLITTDLAPLLFTSAQLAAAIPWREIVCPEMCGGTSFPPKGHFAREV